MTAVQDPGVSLAHYRRHDGAVSLTCLDCMHHRTLALKSTKAVYLAMWRASTI